jgi:hypothetical protein
MHGCGPVGRRYPVVSRLREQRCVGDSDFCDILIKIRDTQGDHAEMSASVQVFGRRQ